MSTPVVGAHPSLRVGNAPCSWGTLEFDTTRAEQIPFDRMLDELADAGYTGTELGDWGYMPTDPTVLKAELDKRRLTMLGAFVPVALKDAPAHAAGIETALKTANLLAAVASSPKPYLVLADANGSVPERTANAGRITPEFGLNAAQWRTFAKGANEIGRAVFEQTGLRTVFHHHCAGYVETPEEIECLLDATRPDAINLVFDTGHFAYGARHCDVMQGLRRFRDRIIYVHLKDCHPDVAREARASDWDYFQALRHGVFCELGKGGVDFRAVLEWLRAASYDGYVLVEQDVLPGMGAPNESAKRNREYLRTVEKTVIEEAACIGH